MTESYRVYTDQDLLDELGRQYSETGNPIHSWEAILLCRKTNITLPTWVMKYLSDAANSIIEIALKSEAGEIINREPEAAGKAIGFGAGGRGQTGYFKTASMVWRDRELHDDVERLIQAGTKPDFAFDEVARVRRISRETVRRAHRRFEW